MIFADTGGLYAAAVPDDPDHVAAVDWLVRTTEPLVTTDYVVDELLALMRARGHNQRAIHAGRRIFSEERGLASIDWVRPEDVMAGWAVFDRFHDKGWSFTDCVSRVVMERLAITTAFAFDEHFRQFGTVVVLPR